MYIDRVSFRKPFTQEDRNFNNETLAFRVKGTPCTVRGTINNELLDMPEGARILVHPTEKVSSIEIYANGSMNLFIRKMHPVSGLEGPVGVIRIRPSVTGPIDQEIFGKAGLVG